MPDLCPRCNRNDEIQKISAIRRDGTVIINASGPSGGVAIAGGRFVPVVGNTRLSGTSTTQLAALFQPPEKPVLKMKPKFNRWSGIALFCWFIALFVMIGIFCTNSSRNYSEGTINTALVVAGAAVCVSLYFAVKGRNEAYPEAKSIYDGEITKWENRMDTYNRIYYCKRDDICFDPQSGNLASPSEFWRLYG